MMMARYQPKSAIRGVPTEFITYIQQYKTQNKDNTQLIQQDKKIHSFWFFRPLLRSSKKLLFSFLQSLADKRTPFVAVVSKLFPLINVDI